MGNRQATIVKEMRNLAAAAQEKEMAAGVKASPEIQGKLLQVAWYLKREGYSEATIRDYTMYLKMLVNYGADLFDPGSVKDVIARYERWGVHSKLMAVAAYTVFASLNEIPWKPPRYHQERKIPFIPLESEIDALISSTGKKMSACLQLLKETGMRIGEACRLKWTDMDVENNGVTVNNPEKHSQPRMFKVSSRLIAMLNTLPRRNEYVFEHMKPNDAGSYLTYHRKRVAYKLQNPRILSIHIHTLRHWYATMEYNRTRDILHVMRQLGHRKIENTLLYTQIIQFESDEYHSAVASGVEEARKLLEAGFEYVATHENQMLFRKRR